MSYFPRGLAATPLTPGVAIEWEEPACLLCGGRQWSWLVEAADSAQGSTGLWFGVVQCQECGLCFTNPRPSLNSIAQFYPAENYAPHRLPQHKEHGPRWLPRFRGPRKTPQALAWRGQGRLLDFGCGGGSFLQRMGDRGWQVTGIDMSATTVCRVRAELGLRVLVGTLPHPELQAASFDVITMWQSLEHVHQPREVLQEAFQLLAPGGKLVVAVPNIDSLAYRWFGGDWFGLDLPRHLTHFTPMTLSLMLERSGFRLGSLRMVRHTSWLRSSATIAARRQHGPYWHRWLTSRPAARLATLYSHMTRQTDCILATAYK